jgi:hypothetical protein
VFPWEELGVMESKMNFRCEVHLKGVVLDLEKSSAPILLYIGRAANAAKRSTT